MNNDTLVLTPSGLIAFLDQIDELNGLDLSLQVNEDSIDVQIGDRTYVLECDPKSTVEVDPEVVDTIDEIDDEGYDDISETEVDTEDEEMEFVGNEVVEGGIIKELIKTLAVGGLVRLTKDAIVKS